MTKISLDEFQAIIDSHSTAQNEIKSELTRQIERDTITHDVTNVIQKKIVTMLKACKKACLNKTSEEREIIVWSTFDKIEDLLAQDVSSLRDKVFYAKGKIDALNDTQNALKEKYSLSIADITRAHEVAQIIDVGEEPINGKNRKPGTRPEKLAVVRRAQDIVKQKQEETSQESE